MPPKNSAWTLLGVSCALGEHLVFADANFDIPCGQITTIIGSSGAGKSSLLELLGGLRQPQNGEILTWFRDEQRTLHNQAWESYRGSERVAEIEALPVWDSGALLVDEPEKGIDSVAIQRIHQYFIKCASLGTTVVVATHDHRWVKEQKETVLIKDGACLLTPVSEVNFLALQQETIEQLRQ